MVDIWSSIYANEGSRPKLVNEIIKHDSSIIISFGFIFIITSFYVWYSVGKRRKVARNNEDEWNENEKLLDCLFHFQFHHILSYGKRFYDIRVLLR